MSCNRLDDVTWRLSLRSARSSGGCEEHGALNTRKATREDERGRKGRAGGGGRMGGR